MSAEQPTPAPEFGPAQAPAGPAGASSPRVAIAAVLIAAVGLLVAAVVYLAGAPKRASAPAQPPLSAVPPQSATPAPPAPPATPPELPRTTITTGRGGREDASAPASQATADDLRRAFAAAADAAQLDPADALRRFESALVALGDAWPALPEPVLPAALESAAAAARRIALADSASAPALAERLAQPALRLLASRATQGDIAPIALSLGLLSRIAATADAPFPLRARAEVRLAEIGLTLPRGASASDAFWAGVADALRRLPPLIVGAAAENPDAGSDAAWKRWVACIDRLAAEKPEERETILLAGAGELLRAASTRSSDAAARRMLTAVLARLDWSAAGSARQSMLAWMDDRRVGTRELASAQQWLASSMPAAGIAGDAVVSGDASDADRSAARDRLAALWSLLPPTVAEDLLRQWHAAASAAIKSSDAAPTDDPARAARAPLARAAVFARLSAAAAALHRRESSVARAILRDISGPIDAASTVIPSAPRLPAADSGDGQWAAKFLSTRRNAAERRRALGELSSRTAALGPIDAAVLAETALISSSADTRQAALRLAERASDQPSMINAVLELLPRSPRTEWAARLIARCAGARLPSVRDREWPVAARRALVDRLLRIYAAGDDLASIDRLGAVIAASYAQWSAVPAPRRRAAPDASPAPSSAPAAAEDPAAAARSAAAGLRADALVASTRGRAAGEIAARFAEADRRIAARRALAEGPTQAFLVEQAYLAEALAAVVSSERPEAQPAAIATLAARADAVAASRGVFEQIEASERAIMTLWKLRLPPAPTP